MKITIFLWLKWFSLKSTKYSYLHKLEKIPEHVVVFQRLQLSDSHRANLRIWVVAVEQLHGQADIQTAAKQHCGEGAVTLIIHTVQWNAAVPGVPCATALQQPVCCQNIFLFPPPDGAQQLRVGSTGKWSVTELFIYDTAKAIMVQCFVLHLIEKRKNISTWGHACTRV